MSGSTPLIDQIDFSSSQKEVIHNRSINAESAASVYGIKTLVALSLVVYGGPIDVAGVPTILANQTVALTNNATNYVYATSAGVVTVTTVAPAGWPGPLGSSAMALYTIVTSGGTYSSIVDWRIAIILSPAASGTVYSDFVGDDGGSPNSGVHGLVPAPNQGDAAANKFLKASGVWATTPSTSVPVFIGDDGGSPNSSVTGTVPVSNQGDSAAGKFLKANGSWVVPPDTNTTYSDFVGDNGGSPNSGVHGLVPAPNQGDASAGKFLKADGLWAVPSGSSAMTVLSPAYAATLTVDLTGVTTPIVVVNVGTLTGNVLFNITNGTDGQVIRTWFTQDSAGSPSGGRTFSAGANLRFSTDTPSPTLSTAAGAIDALGWQWRSTDGKAWLIAVNKGY